MTSRRLHFATAAVALAAVGGAATASASAQGVTLTKTRGQIEIAVAGPRVLIAPGTNTGPLLLSYSLAGGRPRPVGPALSPPSPGRGFAESFDASVSTVAVTRTRETRTGGDIDTRAYAGPADGSWQALGPTGRSGRAGAPSLVRVSGQATLVGVLGTRSDPLLSVHSPGLPPMRLPAFPGIITDQAIVGDLVAIAIDAIRTDDTEGRRLVVLNWRTGKRLYDRRLPWGIGDVDLAPDGRVVASVSYRGQQLALVNARGSGARILTHDRRASITSPRFAGDRIVAIRSLDGPSPGTYVVAVSPTSGRTVPMSPRTDELEAFDADANTVSWIANRCALATAAGGPRMLTVPPGPCFRDELTIRGRRTRLTKRNTVVDLYCQSSSTGSCRGTLHLRLHAKTQSLARHRFIVRSGRSKALTLDVPDATLRRLRRGRSRDLVADTVLRDASNQTQRILGFVPVRNGRHRGAAAIDSEHRGG